jgi:PAS domain S-box-containing protein
VQMRSTNSPPPAMVFDEDQIVTGNAEPPACMEATYRALVETAPDAMLVVDQSGEIKLVNAQAEKQFGYGRAELLGRRITTIIPEGFAEQLLADTLQSAGGSTPQEIRAGVELTGRCKDGSCFPVEVVLGPLQTDGRTLVTAVIRDIRVRKAESARVDRLKNEFVATVSHELRTPLTSIMGALALLRGNTSGPLPEGTSRLVNIAYTNSNRLVRLVNDILDIQRIESGKVQFVRKKVDLRSVLEEAIDSAYGYAASYDVRMRLEASKSACNLHSDRNWLLQIVTNLLSNAIKFSPRGEEVLVTLVRRKGSVSILVRDHGSGVPHDFRSEIFAKFARADTSDSRQKGGTGLGLSIVKQMVSRLGGEVGFGDAPGGGAIFYVDFPNAPGMPSPGAANEESVAPMAETENRGQQ